MTPPPSNPKMKVLSLGLPRTGSASIARALTILGFENVCHGVNIVDNAPPEIIKLFDRAANASFPVLPSYTGQEFTLKDWEELYRNCEASTDVAGLFGPQLVRCYPNAKVILVIRPFDQWYESMNDGVFRYMFSRPADFYCAVMEPLFGSRYLAVGRKLVLGLFNARTVQEARENARSIYDLHHSRIRQMKPSSELFVFDLKDGWGPLCEFLQKPVPSEPFPRVNERAAIQAKMVEIIYKDVWLTAMKLFPWLVGVMVINIGIYYSKLMR